MKGLQLMLVITVISKLLPIMGTQLITLLITLNEEL